MQNMLLNEFLMSPISCEGVFSPAECQSLIELSCEYQKFGETQAPGFENKMKQDFDIRLTLSKYVDPIAENQWIFQRVREVVTQVNQQFFHFQITAFPSLQILEYPVNGFYREHIDLGRGVYSARKLSVVVLLSDPAHFEGGELRGADKEPLPLKQGMVVVFPSYLPHQVTPVTAGKRYTMVTWVLGPPYQ
jgi:PKHD-type hydroxylase